MATRTRVADPALAEFTVKAVVGGVVLGIVFGAANADLGLRVGLTVSASIPAAVMTVALFRLFRARGTILKPTCPRRSDRHRRRRPAGRSSPSLRCSCGTWYRPICRWWRCPTSARCWASRR